jgi:hypothetical protein
MKKEKFYFELFLPEYNLCKEPGSPGSGGTGRKRSEEFKHKNSLSQPTKIKIEVADLELNTQTIFHSTRAAARALNISPSVIDMYFLRNQTKPYKGRYTFKKL